MLREPFADGLRPHAEGPGGIDHGEEVPPTILLNSRMR